MTSTSTDQINTIALDNRLVRFSAESMIKASSIAEYVDITERPSIVGQGRVAEFTIRPEHPVSGWSTGEQKLWAFIASLSGQTEVNLRDLADYFRGDPNSHWLTAAFVALMSDES